jgi:hypothetical protein
MTTTGVQLPSHTRGDTFSYSTAIGNGWVAADFTGGIKFTLRRRHPASSVTSDADADVLAQASIANGQIVASGANLTITIPASVTTNWPAGTAYFDLQGVVSGTPNRVYTIASGVITILPDVTRST